ncbi:MAG: hypothetical protein K2L67_06820 [Clostridia bacterium]|nr:hypothetical protein [Clostridia bacterium]
MILTFTERKFKKLNDKKGNLVKERNKYNDTNDPQKAMRAIYDARIEKLNSKIRNLERKMKK